MVFSWTDECDNKITAVYWSDGLNRARLEEYGKDCSSIYVKYPSNLSNDIYDKYCEVIFYIDAEADWGHEVFSPQIDLTKGAEEIFSRFSKTRRYEVRRAKSRDNLTVDFINNLGEEDLQEYEAYYNGFAQQIDDLGKLDKKKIRAMNESGNFTLAKIVDIENRILAMHGYILDCDTGIAALYSSSSYFREEREERALIGRANGLLHYESMLHFKELGFCKYDLGGIYLGNEKPHHMSVSQFKKSLGGENIAFQSGFLIPIEEIRRIDNNLSKMQHQFENADIVLWGYSAFGRYVERQLKTVFLKSCRYIIDNKLYKAGGEVKCVSEQVLSELTFESVFILVSTSRENYRKIVEQDNVKKYRETGKIICLRG